ncbi:hypothetical protein ACFYW9_19175 [Streptomyces sp. NPDC002698]|uniref:hypothetical protein n=1 Tax=Streptomyces sp. NPDC002698 TaxID=3364660 RepID=UPI0036824AB5
MSHKFEIGDRVTHPRRRGRIGKVMAVEEDFFASVDPVYHVCWTPEVRGSRWAQVKEFHKLKKVEA